MLKARSAEINAFGKEILVTNKGLNYTTASIQLLLMDLMDSANAEVVIGAVGGHGFNAIEELAVTEFWLIQESLEMNQGFFTTENEFRQVGL